MKNYVVPLLLVLGGVGAVAAVVKTTPAAPKTTVVTPTPASFSAVNDNKITQLNAQLDTLKTELNATKASLADAHTTLIAKLEELAATVKKSSVATCNCNGAGDPNCTCKLCNCAAKASAVVPLVNDDNSPVPVRPGVPETPVVLATPAATAGSCANGSCRASSNYGTYYRRSGFFRRW